jgi:uncharacterized protein (DUF1330 family)
VRCYAIAILREATMGPLIVEYLVIVEYLERIDGTLAPFGGHFVVHGGQAGILVGEDPGTLVIIEFPGHDHARRWYASDDCQRILPLRTGNSRSTILLADGAGPAHKATGVLHADNRDGR